MSPGFDKPDASPDLLIEKIQELAGMHVHNENITKDFGCTNFDLKSEILSIVLNYFLKNLF